MTYRNSVSLPCPGVGLSSSQLFEGDDFGFPSQSDASGVCSTNERQRQTPGQTVCETDYNFFQSLYRSRKPIEQSVLFERLQQSSQTLRPI